MPAFLTVCALVFRACTFGKKGVNALNLDCPETEFSESQLLVYQDKSNWVFSFFGFFFFLFAMEAPEVWCGECTLSCTSTEQVRGFWYTTALVLKLAFN